jgi:hypothetical protein
MDVTSPFVIPTEHLKVIENYDNIKTVGAFLEKQNHKYVKISLWKEAYRDRRTFSLAPTRALTQHRYCRTHSCLPVEVQSTFTLHRNILHTILLPVLQIRGQAAQYASSILAHHRQRPSRHPAVDLEVAFRGQARSAFSWVQCFISQEQDWVLTKGCPACIVLKTLQDESFIRIIVAACKVSTHLRDLFRCRREVIQMPDFSFWLTGVRHAVTEDPFWGLHFWLEIEARAISLASGIQELVSQCLLPSAKSSGQSTAPNRSVSDSALFAGAHGVQNGILMRREIKLNQEEEQWIKSLIQACCSTLLTEAERARKLASARRWQEQGGPQATRQRSLTV